MFKGRKGTTREGEFGDDGGWGGQCADEDGREWDDEGHT